MTKADALRTEHGQCAVQWGRHPELRAAALLWTFGRILLTSDLRLFSLESDAVWGQARSVAKAPLLVLVAFSIVPCFVFVFSCGGVWGTAGKTINKGRKVRAATAKSTCVWIPCQRLEKLCISGASCGAWDFTWPRGL